MFNNQVQNSNINNIAEKIEKSCALLDKVEQTAMALGRMFSNVAGDTSSTAKCFELMLASQTLADEAREAKKAIKAIKATSPELSESFKSRYQSILEGLSGTVNKTGLEGMTSLESEMKQKLLSIKNNPRSPISEADMFEVQFLMNSLQRLSDISVTMAKNINSCK